MKKIPGFIILLIATQVISASKISDIVIEGELLTAKERILSVLPFKLGDPYQPEKLEQGIQLLKKWGIFDEISAKTEYAAKGTIIRFKLHEALVIGEIDVDGNYPYVETKIRKRLNLQVGDMLIPERAEEQKERIRSFYERRGYYNTRIDIKEEPAAANNSVYLTYHIIKGERIRIGKLDLEGVKAFPKGRIYTFIKPHNYYSERELKNAIQKLTEFYRARGYLKAHVRVLEKNSDLGKRRVALKLGIQEGPKVEVFFRGTKRYRLATFKKIVTLFRDGNFDMATLEESRDALLKKFWEDGYKEAEVVFKKEKIDPEHFQIYFNIRLRPQQFVKSIHFEGSQAISEKEIKKQMLTKERSLTKKATEYYQSKGFSDATVGLPQVTIDDSKIKLDIAFNVDEGPLVTINSVMFDGNKSLQKEQLIKPLENKEGLPFNELVLKQDKERLQFLYADHGHPYAEISQEIKRSENKIGIIYQIDEGPTVQIGEIFIFGDVLTGVKAIRQAIGIRSGDLYNQQKILEAQLNLRRLGAFNVVNVETIGLEEKEKVIHLKVKVEEKSPFVVDLEGQYSTDKAFGGVLKFTNFNSFGWAKQTGLLFQAGKEKDRLELSWFDPRFVGSDVQMTIASWIDYEEEPVETSLQTGGAVAFFRQFHRFGFLTRYELARNYIFEGRARDTGSLRDSTLSQITLSGSYDRRNSFSDPTRGFFGLVGANVVNEIKGLGANFAKLKWVFSHYYSPFGRLTFSNTLRFDRIQSIGSNISIPQRQLFTLGGDDTLRGFQEDVLGPLDATGQAAGGRLRWIYNAEFHLRLVKDLQLATFYDAGSLTDTFPEIDWNTIRHSVGVGLRYVTPVGPIRADYGVILDRKSGENFGRFHLTFGYPF